MKLEKAIKRLNQEKVRSERGLVDTLPDALQLGIEALKRVAYMRDMGDIVATEPLLGETEE